MQMESHGGGFGKMFAKAFAGESMVQNTYTARGAGMITFGASFPGQIKAITIAPGQEMILQKSAFLAAEAGVEISIHFRKNLGVGFFGCEASSCSGFPAKVRLLWRLMTNSLSTSCSPDSSLWWKPGM